MTIDPAIFFFYISSRSFSVTQHFHFHVLYSASHCHWHCGTKAVTVPSTGQCSVNGLFLPFLSTLFRSIQQRHAAYRKQGRKRERERKKKERRKKECTKRGRERIEILIIKGEVEGEERKFVSKIRNRFVVDRSSSFLEENRML